MFGNHAGSLSPWVAGWDHLIDVETEAERGDMFSKNAHAVSSGARIRM